MPVPVISIFEAVDFDAELARGAAALEGGGIVVLPTETVYGAAGRLDHSAARERLGALRAGADRKPLTIHVAQAADALQYLGDVNELGHRLMRKLWPGPVGLCFDVSADRRAAVAAALGVDEADLYDGETITLRCPDHPLTAELLRRVSGPVVLTMASPTAGGVNFRPETLAAELDGKADLIFDAGPTRFSKPSTLLKVTGDQYSVVRVGIYDERIIERLLRTTVLFVCSGNTCRSPMAEAIFRSALARNLNVSEAELDGKGINVMSAGTYAMPGSRATPQAVDALQDEGIDLTRHRSRPLTVELVHQADAIYTMGQGHAQTVRALVPSAVDKVQTLDPDGDIEDPIGSDVSVYKRLAGQLQQLVAKRLAERPLA